VTFAPLATVLDANARPQVRTTPVTAVHYGRGRGRNTSPAKVGLARQQTSQPILPLNLGQLVTQLAKS
jgi:hypothetical protein